MNLNGEHPNKPQGIFCMRAALMKWTGLNEHKIAVLESQKILKAIRFKQKNGRLGRRYYLVSEIEKIVKQIQNQ